MHDFSHITRQCSTTAYPEGCWLKIENQTLPLVQVARRLPLEQWFSTFITLRPFNTVPYGLVTSNHKISFAPTP